MKIQQRYSVLDYAVAPWITGRQSAFEGVRNISILDGVDFLAYLE